MEQCIFAAGNFHSAQHYFDQIPGMKVTSAGYIGGTTEDPTYEEVATGVTGHIEAIHVQFDSSVVDLATICRHFFRIHDATDPRYGLDGLGHQRSAIFYVTDEQKVLAEQVKDEVARNKGKPVVTVVERAGPFYYAEVEHQKYAERTGEDVSEVSYQPI